MTVSRGSIAAKVRAHREQHPELYCAYGQCLWRTVTIRGPNPCRNHPNAGSGKPVTEEVKNA